MPRAPASTSGTWPPVFSSEAVSSSPPVGESRCRGAAAPFARPASSALAKGLAGLVLCCMALMGQAGAVVLLSQEEALALAFPGAQVERHTAYLDSAQMDEIHRLAGPKVEPVRAMVPYYQATRAGVAVGVAYFDTRRVRTEAATVMYVVDAAGRLARVEVIAFHEPREYLPRPAWLEQFKGRTLDKELELKRGIRGMTGASLTARTLTDGARRILSLHAVLAPLQKDPAADAGDEP